MEQEWRKHMRGLCERMYVHVTTVTYLSPHTLSVILLGRVTRWSCEHKVQYSPQLYHGPSNCQTKGNPQGNPSGSVGVPALHPCNFLTATPYWHCKYVVPNFRARALVGIRPMVVEALKCQCSCPRKVFSGQGINGIPTTPIVQQVSLLPSGLWTSLICNLQKFALSAEAEYSFEPAYPALAPNNSLLRRKSNSRMPPPRTYHTQWHNCKGTPARFLLRHHAHARARSKSTRPGSTPMTVPHSSQT
jgi:hypothetical protein